MLGKEREPILMCATGKKGVGKTYTTTIMLEDYVKSNRKTGKKGRKVLIYDINMEYTQYKAISVKDIPKFSRQKHVEIRRVLPIMDDGKMADLSDMLDILSRIINNFRGGMLVLEDINRYLVASKTVDVIGLLATNRHRDLDIICHFQSLSALDTRMWQNTAFVRFHYQIDDIKRYHQRIPNFEMFKIAQCLVEYKYLKLNDKRFYCYIASDDNYIKGAFSKNDFQYACHEYLERNPKRISDFSKRFGSGLGAREKAKQSLINELFQKYYRGI
jgi:hypothetical protein